MKNRHLHLIMYSAVPLIAALLLGPGLASAQTEAGGTQNIAVQGDVVKHRIELITVPPDPAKQAPTNTLTFVLKTEGWKALLLEEGIVINEEDWAAAQDLLKLALNSSTVFRSVYTGVKPQPAGKDIQAAGFTPSMIMLARYGVGTAGKRVLLTLIDSASGNTLKSAGAVDTTMELAIKKALAEIEEEAALMVWRCRVVAQKDKEMIIDRGRMDGLRKGQRYVGYALKPAAAENKNMPPELLLMQFGDRKGIYEVSEEGHDFCKVAPVDNAPLLSAGDVLELPSLELNDRKRDTRGRRAWDKIYKKQ